MFFNESGDFCLVIGVCEGIEMFFFYQICFINLKIDKFMEWCVSLRKVICLLNFLIG